MATTKNGTASPTPAQVLREQKAKIDEINANAPPIPRMPTDRHPASDAAEAVGDARDTIGAIQVPMTLAEIAAIMGTDCHADDFASTALSTLADQLDAVSGFAESDNGGTYNTYVVIQNIVKRMELASQVTRWLASETPGDVLPEVQS